jgi:hypothetical protein
MRAKFPRYPSYSLAPCQFHGWQVRAFGFCGSRSTPLWAARSRGATRPDRRAGEAVSSVSASGSAGAARRTSLPTAEPVRVEAVDCAVRPPIPSAGSDPSHPEEGELGLPSTREQPRAAARVGGLQEVRHGRSSLANPRSRTRFTIDDAFSPPAPPARRPLPHPPIADRLQAGGPSAAGRPVRLRPFDRAYLLRRGLGGSYSVGSITSGPGYVRRVQARATAPGAR